MKQVSVIISTYTADVSGVCSALYELGGMVVIHDPSGCNSTYNTHDEPRWYDQDSLVFISGLSEIDAIMGNDEKFIRDVVRAARDLSPRFIALVRTPVPMMIGTDFEAIKDMIEAEMGIPVFYFATSGMHSYIQGAGDALAVVAENMVKEIGEKQTDPQKNAEPLAVNLLGVTPLDFSVNDTLSSIKGYLEEHGCRVQSCFAMGSSPEEIAGAGKAAVNLILSSSGLPAAKVLQRRFQIPYVAGLPTGAFKEAVIKALKKSAGNKESIIAYKKKRNDPGTRDSGLYIIGETVISRSLAEALWITYHRMARVICPLETDEELADEFCLMLSGEEEIQKELEKAKIVIADPMYRPICPETVHFIPMPHEAFSGRIYRRQIPDLTDGSFLDPWFKAITLDIMEADGEN